MTAITTSEPEVSGIDESPEGLARLRRCLQSDYPGKASLALIILATLAVIFALEWAQSFVISLLLGSYSPTTLNPPVTMVQRLHIRARWRRYSDDGVVFALALGATL